MGLFFRGTSLQTISSRSENELIARGKLCSSLSISCGSWPHLFLAFVVPEQLLLIPLGMLWWSLAYPKGHIYWSLHPASSGFLLGSYNGSHICLTFVYSAPSFGLSFPRLWFPRHSEQTLMQNSPSFLTARPSNFLVSQDDMPHNQQAPYYFDPSELQERTPPAEKVWFSFLTPNPDSTPTFIPSSCR